MEIRGSKPSAKHIFFSQEMSLNDFFLKNDFLIKHLGKGTRPLNYANAL